MLWDMPRELRDAEAAGSNPVASTREAPKSLNLSAFRSFSFATKCMYVYVHVSCKRLFHDLSGFFVRYHRSDVVQSHGCRCMAEHSLQLS